MTSLMDLYKELEEEKPEENLEQERIEVRWIIGGCKKKKN